MSLLEFGQVPMLARPVSSLPLADDLPGGCAYEPKFDGYRAMLYVQGGECRIQSRHGQDITYAFPDIVAAAAIELPDGVVVDGELVVWGEDAYDFIAVQRRIAAPPRPFGLSPASFIAFDLLMWDDDDLRGEPLTKRRQMLDLVFVDHQMPFQVVPQTTDRAEAASWMREFSRNDIGIEGLVVKGLESTYTPGLRGWRKLRFQDTVEAVVCAVVGPLDHPTRLVLAQPSPGGMRTMGWTNVLTPKQQLDVGELVVLPHAPDSFSALRDATDVQAVQPTLVVEIAAQPGEDHPAWQVYELVRVRPDLGTDEVGADETT